MAYADAKQAEQARKALEALEAMGELRPAEAKALKELREAQPVNQGEIGETHATYRGALQGATFQHADEITGLLGGDTNEARRRNLEAEAAYPGAYNKGKTAGAIGSGGALGYLTRGMATGAGLLNTMKHGAKLGGLEGALWGAGGGVGLPEKGADAVKYGAVGAGVGGAAPAVVAAGAKGAGMAADVVGGALNIGNQGRAQRIIAETLDRSGRTAQDVAQEVAGAAADGQPMFRSMDAMGMAGQRRASSIVRAGGEGSEEIAQFLKQRQQDAPDRMVAFTGEAFGLDGQTPTAEAARSVVKDNRKNVADTLFDDAAKDAAPVDVRQAVEQLDATIAQMNNSGIRPPEVVREYKRLRAQLAGETPEGDPTTLSDYQSVLALWREVRDKTKKAFKDGRGDIGEALAPIRDSLQAALEESSDLYRFATDNYREGSKVLDAVDEGAQMATRGRAQDNTPKFLGMTDQQQRAARIGYGDKVQESLERNKAREPDVSREFTSSKRRDESQVMAIDPDLLLRRVDREGTMHGTHQRALGGSKTQDNFADQADLGVVADAGRVARDGLSGNFGQAISNAVAAIAPRLSGQNEATRKLIARALLSNDPMAVLAPAIKSQKDSQHVQRVVEALLRGGERGQEVVPRP